MIEIIGNVTNCVNELKEVASMLATEIGMSLDGAPPIETGEVIVLRVDYGAEVDSKPTVSLVGGKVNCLCCVGGLPGEPLLKRLLNPSDGLVQSFSEVGVDVFDNIYFDYDEDNIWSLSDLLSGEEFGTTACIQGILKVCTPLKELLNLFNGEGLHVEVVFVKGFVLTTEEYRGFLRGIRASRELLSLVNI